MRLDLSKVDSPATPRYPIDDGFDVRVVSLQANSPRNRVARLNDCRVRVRCLDSAPRSVNRRVDIRLQHLRLISVRREA
jgi:hypothetical protein